MKKLVLALLFPVSVELQQSPPGGPVKQSAINDLLTGNGGLTYLTRSQIADHVHYGVPPLIRYWCGGVPVLLATEPSKTT